MGSENLGKRNYFEDKMISFWKSRCKTHGKTHYLVSSASSQRSTSRTRELIAIQDRLYDKCLTSRAN